MTKQSKTIAAKRAALASSNGSALLWDKTPPGKPGWYWYQDLREWVNELPCIVYVRDYAGKLAIGNSYLRDGWCEKARWAGPIPEPAQNAQGERLARSKGE